MKKIRLTERDIHKIITETAKRILAESFSSGILRDFFQQHGGVDAQYRQFSLSDINDEQILYSKEFESRNDAMRELHNLKTSSGNKCIFLPFGANDGTTLLIGIDKSTVDTDTYSGHEYPKRIADRLNANGWDHKTRDNRYIDDNDTYYYQSPAQDFGLFTSNDFKNKAQDYKNKTQGMSREQQMKFNKDKLNRLRDYMQRHYPNK